MRSTKQAGYIRPHRGWWELRYRERVGVGGEVKTVHRAYRLALVDAEHKTRASVRRLAEDFLERRNRQSVSPLTVTTLEDFYGRVYLPFIRENKRPSTIHGYRQIWDAYLKQRCGPAWLRDVRTYHIQAWLNQIAKECGLSKTTLQHIKHFLSGLFRHAAQQDYFDSSHANPVQLAMVPAKAPRGREGRAYSLEEINQMLRLLSEPAVTVVATAAYTGLRRGELQGLQWEDFQAAPDEDSLGGLRVTRSVWHGLVGEPKTEKSKAWVPVISQLAGVLESHRLAGGNPVSGPIFRNRLGRPLDLDGRLCREDIKPILEKAGVEWCGWHGFRRGLASNLNRLGIDDSVIQSIIRHSNLATTQDLYIKTASPDVVHAMERFSRSELCPTCAPATGARSPN